MFQRSGIATMMAPAILLAAGSFSSAIAGSPPHKTYTIVIDKVKFGAVPSGLRAGDSILWVNHDIFHHTATAADHSFDIDLAPGKSGKILLRKARPITVSCKFHPGMKVRLNVAK